MSLSEIKNRLLTLFFRPLPKKQLSQKPAFLIVSTTGLGDTLWATPAISALKRAYPKSNISLLTHKMGRDLLSNHPNVDQIFTIDESKIRLLKSLKNRFEVILLFHASQRWLFPFCRLLSPQFFIGTKGQNKGLDSLFSHLCPWQKPHEIDRRLEQLIPLGIQSEERQLLYQCSEKEKKEAEKTLPQKRGFFVALHPGAKDGFKCWPLELFMALAEKIEKELEATVFISRSASDPFHPSMEKYTILTPSSIRELAAYYSHMDLLVTNDTGPMHLMSALNRPLIALFGPTDPSICGPTSAHSQIIKVPVTCTPCRRRKCQDPFCMRQIGVVDLFTQIKKRLLSA
jgi:ADP-heptose:LPS heptosyltransferase